MPKITKYSEPVSTNQMLPLGKHLVKINPSPDLKQTNNKDNDFSLHISSQDQKNDQLVLPIYNKDGSFTDFIPIMDSTMFRIQAHVAAMMGVGPNQEETKNSDDMSESDWTDFFENFNNLDTKDGKHKFVAWIRQNCERPYWIVLKEDRKQKRNDGQPKTALMVFGDEAPHACAESEIMEWRGPGDSATEAEPDMSNVKFTKSKS